MNNKNKILVQFVKVLLSAIKMLDNNGMTYKKLNSAFKNINIILKSVH